MSAGGRFSTGIAAVFALAAAAASARAQDKIAAPVEVPYSPSPPIVAASDEPLRTMQTFKVPERFQIDCYAAEPRVAQPVCFWFARNGDCYVAETFRHSSGVFDIREHMDWLDDDVAARSVDDRVAMYKKHLGLDFPKYEIEHERVRLLRDTDGDGHADWDSIFADGFHFAADGIGAGLLENKGDVYYTCIPNLWRLRDDDHDGRAEIKDKMSTGWGIRVALLGHDMHGLQIGPDNKLYWSIGDRGFRVTNKEGVLLDNPLTGAVLRSNLDGSELEIFATGLRNPQELAFDDFGNLWTGDNNSDGGDEARFVQVLEAGDTGWRQAYQWLGEPNTRGPWNDERLWKPHFDGQAAYIVPPIANVAHGPSGLVCNPGTGMSDAWNGHFFLCDFEGASEWSGVITFTLQAKGASYSVSPIERFVWGPLATDCDFGLDGGLYVSDWVAGWGKTGKGRIWRAFEPDVAQSAIVKETRELLKSGMTKRTNAELATLLEHKDRRVRQDAHLELASRKDGEKELVRVARDVQKPLLARLHATWALGIVLGRDPKLDLSVFGALLADPDAEVRAQAAHVLGDRRSATSVDAMIRLLGDPSPRVRMYAAIGLARLKDAKAVEPVLALIREVGEKDAHLRHAAIYALWSCASQPQLTDLATNASVDVRVAAVVALRRRHSYALTAFIDDGAPRVAAEAARAIYDLQWTDQLPRLAALFHSESTTSPTSSHMTWHSDPRTMDVRVPVDLEADAYRAGNGLVRRVLNANYRLGTTSAARVLASFAANFSRLPSLDDPKEMVSGLPNSMSPEAREEALNLLAQWEHPPGRDLLTGEWAPLPPRNEPELKSIVGSLAPLLGDDTPPNVLRAWVKLVGQMNIAEASPRLTAMAIDVKRDASLRAAALRALGTLKPVGVVDTLKQTLFDASSEVRAASLASFQDVAPEEAVPLLEAALSSSLAERRVAYQGLAKLETPRVDDIFVAELAKLQAGFVPPEAALDLVKSAEKRSADNVKQALAARVELRKGDEKVGPYADAIYGGDAARGRDVFRGKTELECLRCHMAENEGGVVGPNLHEVGKRLTRYEILESIVDPNRRFAPGYQGTVVFQKDGPPIEGLVIEDNATLVRVRKSDGNVVEIEKTEIEALKPGLSAMPANLHEHLSREEMRDVIEYLTTL